MYAPILRLPQTRNLPHISSVDWMALRDELMPMLGFVLVDMIGAQVLLLVSPALLAHRTQR